MPAARQDLHQRQADTYVEFPSIMGAEHSKASRREKDAEAAPDSVRKLRGNCNSTTLHLVIVDGWPQPLVTVSGNCNEVKITLTQVECVHGAQCAKRETPDRPVKITGNCNHYKIHIMSYGPPGKELLSVIGNANDAKVVNMRDPEKVTCDCVGHFPPGEDDQPDLLGDETAAPSASVPAFPTHPVEPLQNSIIEQPPPYEPRRGVARGPIHSQLGDTKTLLVSSISSLDGTTDNDDALTEATSRRSSIDTVEIRRETLRGMTNPRPDPDFRRTTTSPSTS